MYRMLEAHALLSDDDGDDDDLPGIDVDDDGYPIADISVNTIQVNPASASNASSSAPKNVRVLVYLCYGSLECSKKLRFI